MESAGHMANVTAVCLIMISWHQIIVIGPILEQVVEMRELEHDEGSYGSLGIGSETGVEHCHFPCCHCTFAEHEKRS